MAGNWPPRARARRLQIFVSDFSATGVVRNAIALANEASASGYQVRLLACSPQGVLRGDVHSTVTVVGLIDRRNAELSRERQMQKAVLAYRRHIRSWRPDIMLSAGNHGHLLSCIAWVGLPGRKLLRISNEVTHRSPSLLTRAWRTSRFWLMARLADRLVYVSRNQQRHPLLSHELAAGRATVIPNGVDVEAVRSAARGKCAHRWAEDQTIPFLLAVGRHARQKNFDTLLAAFAQARARQPLRLIFLGDGKSAEIARLRQMAARFGIGPDVDFVPATSNPFPFMAAARALVLPSLWEGSANVLLESMACGTAVIASRTAGDSELVLGLGRYGTLVDPDDVIQLRDAMLRQTGPDAIRPGTRAHCFDRTIALRRYIRLFDELVEQNRKRNVAEKAV